MSLTKATWPLVIAGKEFAASPLTDKDYEELDNYIQSRVIEVARASLSSLSTQERSEMLQAAIKAAASSGWGTTEGGKIMRTVEGMLRLGWQMIRSTRISYEDFCKLARKDTETTLASVEAIDVVFGKLNFSTDEDAEESSSENTKS